MLPRGGPEALGQVSELLNDRRMVGEKIRRDQFPPPRELVHEADIGDRVTDIATPARLPVKRSMFCLERWKVIVDEIEQTACRSEKPIEVVCGIVAAVLSKLERDLAPDAKADELADCTSSLLSSECDHPKNASPAGASALLLRVADDLLDQLILHASIGQVAKIVDEIVPGVAGACQPRDERDHGSNLGLSLQQ